MKNSKPNKPQGNNGASERLNITLIPEVLARAAALMKERGMVNKSEYLATLIREDYDRRGRPPLGKA